MTVNPSGAHRARRTVAGDRRGRGGRAEQIVDRNPALTTGDGAPILRSLTSWDGWWYLGIVRDGYHVGTAGRRLPRLRVPPALAVARPAAVVAVAGARRPDRGGACQRALRRGPGGPLSGSREGRRPRAGGISVRSCSRSSRSARSSRWPTPRACSCASRQAPSWPPNAIAACWPESSSRWPPRRVSRAPSWPCPSGSSCSCVTVGGCARRRRGSCWDRWPPSHSSAAWRVLAGSAGAYGAAQAAWGRAGVGGAAPDESLISLLSLVNLVQLVTLLVAVFLLVFLRPDRIPLPYGLLTVLSLGLVFASGSLESIGRHVMMRVPVLLAPRRSTGALVPARLARRVRSSCCSS